MGWSSILHFVIVIMSIQMCAASRIMQIITTVLSTVPGTTPLYQVAGSMYKYLVVVLYILSQTLATYPEYV